MKTIKKLSVVVLAISTFFSSCNSSDGGSGGGFSGPATGTFIKATAAGSEFLTQEGLANGAYATGNLVLSGTTITGKSVGIQLYALDGTLEVGTYNVSALNESSDHTGNLNYIDVNTSTFVVSTYNSAFCDNANGTVEITFIDETKIEGTFSFVGKEVLPDDNCSGGTKSVTNGSFRLEL